MCDIEIPLVCKRPPLNSALFENAAKMAKPTLNTLKNNIDKINTRLKEIKNNPSFRQNPIPMGVMREFQQLLKKRENFISELRSDPNYEDFKSELKAADKNKLESLKTIAKLNDKEKEEFFAKWRKMAKPKKSKLLGALSSINHALAKVLEDKFWCKNPLRKRHWKELIVHRNKICRKLLKYQPCESASRECFQFKPCKLKVVKGWEQAKKNKRGMNARFLKFDFDDNLNRMGLPKYHTILDSLRKYNKFVKILQYNIDEKLVETKEQKCHRIKKLNAQLANCQKRKEVLIELKRKIDERLKNEIKVDAVKLQANQDKEKPSGYWNKGLEIKPFSNNLQLPSIRRLKENFELQRKLLKEIKAIEEIKMGAKCKNVSGQKSKTSKTSQPTQNHTDQSNKNIPQTQPQQVPQTPQPTPQAPVDKTTSEEEFYDAHDTTVTNASPGDKKANIFERNPTKIRKLNDGLNSNIEFMKDFIKNMPHKDDEKPNVNEPKKECEFNWEASALPRYRILKETLAKYEEMLAKFKLDVGNKAVIKAAEDDEKNGEKKQLEPSSDNTQNTSSNDVKNISDYGKVYRTSKTTEEIKKPEEPTPDETEKPKEVEIEENIAATSESQPKSNNYLRRTNKNSLEARKQVYERLKSAKEKVEELVKRQEERMNEMNSQDTKGPSYFSHNKVCSKIEEEKPRKKYKLQKVFKSKSRPTRTRMLYALKKHMEWIDEMLKRRDARKIEIETILEKLQKGDSSCCDEGECEISEGNVEDNSKKNENVKTKEQQEEEIKILDVDKSPNSKATTYLYRYLRHKFILIQRLKELDKESESEGKSLHLINHEIVDAYFQNKLPKTYFDFSKKGPADLKYTEKLAEPKKVVLQSTFDEFSSRMSPEKQEKIKHRLKGKFLRPEDLEAKVREVSKPKPKVRNLAKKVKAHISKQIYDQLAKILKKKIAKEMAHPRRGEAISQPFREVEKSIFMFLMAVNGIPRSNQTCEMYNKFTSVISGFLLEALQKNLKE